MTEDEKFEEVLRELTEFLLDLGDLASRVVLIGGQVLALETRSRRGSANLEVETETGVRVTRGFSYEPDLLFDLDGNDFAADRLPEVLRTRGYRQIRQHRWMKPLRSGEMILDFFAPAGVPPDELPIGMTPLPDAELALRRRQVIELRVDGRRLLLTVPDPVSFLALKLRAKEDQRPTETKDSFDLYAYVRLIGTASISQALVEAGPEGARIRARLVNLFWDEHSAGTRDLLDFVTGYSDEERELLVRDAVDLFEALRRT